MRSSSFLGAKIIILSLLVSSGCVPYKKLKYVQEDKDQRAGISYQTQREPKTIQPDDKLYIRVFSIDEKVTTIFESRIYSGSQENTSLISYTVDDFGYINFPFIGQLYVKDITPFEAQQKIEEALQEYMRNVRITVRFVGNTITLLGEVRRPGEYPFYDEKINVFEAISFAGGIADFGNKTKVVLIRENNGKVKYYNLDLTNRKIVSSDYYYLLPNDIILVEATNAKYRRSYRDLQLVSTILASVTILVAVMTLYYNINR